MTSFNLFADQYLMAIYRITGHTFVDFLLGTFLLGMVCVVVGEFCISVVFLINRKYIDRHTGEVVRFQNLSVDALVSGNKTAYEASNKLANDAFGRVFFLQIAMSASFLWPIFFVLGWMQHRFADVSFDVLFTESTVGAGAVFVALYAAAFIIFKRIKYKLPYFRRLKPILDAYQGQSQKMKSFADLIPARRSLRS